MSGPLYRGATQKKKGNLGAAEMIPWFLYLILPGFL